MGSTPDNREAIERLNAEAEKMRLLNKRKGQTRAAPSGPPPSVGEVLIPIDPLASTGPEDAPPAHVPEPVPADTSSGMTIGKPLISLKKRIGS